MLIRALVWTALSTTLAFGQLSNASLNGNYYFRHILLVTNGGGGIPHEEWERIFERFYRADPARSRETGGTGLGLAIVKHVMQRHGGQLQITSELGNGSVFKLIFPAGRWLATA